MDFRVYLSLEAAFIRRLQKSWQEKAVPLYTKLYTALEANDWATAYNLVPEFDMASVGYENREYIKWLLFSFGCFGASMASDGQPTFVGVTNHNNLLDLTTTNIIQYLDHKATTALQDDVRKLIADAQAKALKFDPYHDDKGRFATSEDLIPSKEEVRAARLYQDAQEEFKRINGYLRHPDQYPDFSDDEKKNIDNLNALLKRSSMPETEVFRGLHDGPTAHNLFKLHEGDIISYSGFFSTSTSKEVATIYANGGTVVVISVPKGTKGIYLPHFTGKNPNDEREVLLPSGVTLQVTAINKEQNRVSMRVVAA